MLWFTYSALHAVVHIQCFTYSALHAVVHIQCFTCCGSHTVLYIQCFTCCGSHTVLYMLSFTCSGSHTVFYMPWYTLLCLLSLQRQTMRTSVRESSPQTATVTLMMQTATSATARPRADPKPKARPKQQQPRRGLPLWQEGRVRPPPPPERKVGTEDEGLLSLIVTRFFRPRGRWLISCSLVQKQTKIFFFKWRCVILEDVWNSLCTFLILYPNLFFFLHMMILLQPIATAVDYKQPIIVMSVSGSASFFFVIACDICFESLLVRLGFLDPSVPS